MPDNNTIAHTETEPGTTLIGDERERLLQALIGQVQVAKRPFTRNTWWICLLMAALAVVVVPVAVFFHYVWQSGFPVALFPLALCLMALTGILVFAFNGIQNYETERMRNLTPIVLVGGGILIGVYLVQMSAGIHFLAKATGVVQWTGESLTTVGAVVAKAKQITSDVKAVSSDVKGVSSDIKGVVDDAKGTVVGARETITEAGKLAAEGESATKAARGMLEEAKALYDLIKLWFAAKDSQEAVKVGSPSAAQPKDDATKNEAASETTGLRVKDPTNWFASMWSWVKSIWGGAKDGEKSPAAGANE